MKILQRNRHTLQTHTTDTFLFISHTTNVLLFKFRCNIFFGVRIIKDMPGSVASGTPYITESGFLATKLKKIIIFSIKTHKTAIQIHLV
jgi:hypothetical protein